MKKNSKPAAPTRAEAEPFQDGRRTNMRFQIENAATELFFHKGYDATTIRMIADACGITPGAIYNHFATKEDLLYEIAGNSIALTEGMILNAIALAGNDPVQKFRAAVSAFVRFHAEHRLSALVAATDYTALPEPRLSEIKKLRQKTRAMFEKIIASGLKAGVFHLPKPRGVSAERFASIAIGDMCLRVAEWFDPEGPLKVQEVAAFYSGLALRMLGVEGDPMTPGKPA